MLAGMQETRPSVGWRSGPPEDIVWARFGEDFIAFHRPSGKTHFLNAATHVLISEILIETQDLDSIVGEFIAAEYDIDQTEFVDQMKSMLDHLENLGLVDRV